VKATMRIRGPGLMALLGIYGMCCTAFAADNPKVVVHDAWVRLPAASRTQTAAYMVIENKSTSARSIVSASSADAAKIELHEMKMTGSGKADAKDGMPHAAMGMMTMTPVTRIEIPANGRATLAPNGYHLMVFGLKSKLTDGGKFAVTLKLDDGSTVPVTASVRSPE
jgi:periplasmic copper chaperone A